MPCGYTLFPSADETSLGTTRHILSIYLPHLLQLIPSSYWTLTCLAALSLTIASCGFCSSDQRFAIRFPSDSTSRWTPLSLAVSFPLLGRIRDFHPLATCAARRTKKHRPFFPVRRCLSCPLYPFFPVPANAYASRQVLPVPAYPLISSCGSVCQAPVPFSASVRPACVASVRLSLG